MGRDRTLSQGATVDALASLLRAAAEGDDRAVAEFVRRTQADLWRLCAALGPPGDEEDLAQETYLRAFESVREWPGDPTPVVWLADIGRRVCGEHRRGSGGRPVAGAGALPLHLDPAHVELRGWLDHLDPDRRDAFVLTQMSGFSYTEAARMLGCSLPTARSRVARAKADLAIVVRASQAV